MSCEKRQVFFYAIMTVLRRGYGSRNFWCRGYYVDTVGKNARIIEEYIRNQLEEDYMADQISIKEFIDPFTGNKNK